VTVCLLAGAAIASCSASGSELNSGDDDSSSSSGGNQDIIDPSSRGGNANTGGAEAGAFEILVDDQHSCDNASFEFESVIPTVMILVDRSSSMFDVPYGVYPNRWEPLKLALTGDAVTNLGVVGSLQPAVRFGFAAYTSQKANAAACPLVLGAEVPIALNNYGPIRQAYDAVSYDPILDGGGADLNFKGETPTGEAINVIVPVLNQFPEPGPKYLLLVTDGQPDTCGVPDPQCGQDVSVAAVQYARTLGIGTFVIGIEMTEFDASRHLTQLANAGTGLPVEQGAVFPNCQAWLSSLPGGGTSATYSSPMGTAAPYLPQSPEQLAGAIAAIIGSVRSCEFDLMSVSVVTDRAAEGQVQLGGRLLEYGSPDGWELVGTSTIRINGLACEEIRITPQPFLYVGFPCDVLVY
jgi:hypothetical protein